jgi:Ca2+-binding RTX toxin-like protein
VIVNGISSNAGPIQLAAGLDLSDLWFTRSGEDLVIQIINWPTMTVKGWFQNGYSQLSSLVLADGSEIGTAAITALATAMTGVSFNPATATAMPTTSSVQTALATNWSRTITGGSSNATLNGVYGNNTLDPGGSANDTLIGGSGSDSSSGSSYAPK